MALLPVFRLFFLVFVLWVMFCFTFCSGGSHVKHKAGIRYFSKHLSKPKDGRKVRQTHKKYHFGTNESVDELDEFQKLHNQYLLEHDHSSCMPPDRLPDELLERLHFFAFTSTINHHLLRRFYGFYQQRGIDFNNTDGKVKLILHDSPGGNLSACLEVLDELGATVGGNVEIENRTFSGILKVHTANAYARTLPPDALLMYPDSDEFYDIPGEAFLEYSNMSGGFVLGHMVDRIPEDWELRVYDGSEEMWDFYPRRCDVTAKELKGANTKWMVVAAQINGVQVQWLSNHFLNIEPELKFRQKKKIITTKIRSLPFSHYRLSERPDRHDRRDKLGTHFKKIREPETSHFNQQFKDRAKCGVTCPTKIQFSSFS